MYKNREPQFQIRGSTLYSTSNKYTSCIYTHREKSTWIQEKLFHHIDKSSTENENWNENLTMINLRIFLKNNNSPIYVD